MLKNFFRRKNDEMPQLRLDEYRRLEASFRKYVREGKPVKLHVGCGPRILKDWLNLDLVFEPFEPYMIYFGDTHYPPALRGERDEFYAIDVAKYPLPLPDNSVDIIFHEDFLEHLDQKQQILFLAEMSRLLKRDGVHRVNTPDLRVAITSSSDPSRGFAGIVTDEWDRWNHKMLCTPALLREMALLTGYSQVLFNQRDKSIAHAMLPTEYRPGKDRSDDGNIFADLVK